jgi:dipeptidyl aminopeptidase/acylaminoacyl peptidase
VDFDRSLHTAVAKLGEALGDSAESPRFVETLPRRGYRFLAGVELLPLVSAAIEAPRDIAAPHPEPRPAVSRQTPRRRLKLGAAALALVLAGAGATWWWIRGTQPAWEPASQFTLTQLTRDPGLTLTPALSPDGTLIAYASDRGGEGNLDNWVQQVSGRSSLRLTHDEAADFDPEFSPDGTKIVFCSARDGGGIYIIPALGGDAKLLAKGGHRPRFSPDGKQIAYIAGPTSSPQETELYVVSAGGGSPRRLQADFYYPANPTWAPDSQHLLFAGVHPAERPDDVGAKTRHRMDLWVTPIDGGPAVRTRALEVLPRQQVWLGSLDAWDAKENYLIFSGETRDSINLWSVPISRTTFRVNGPAERLTFGTGESGASLAAGRIAFLSGFHTIGIWGLPIDPVQGVATGEPERLTRSAASDFACDVSPDGRRLVFLSNRSGEIDIWVKDLDSGNECNVTAKPGREFSPKFAPDGSKIAYLRLEGGEAGDLRGGRDSQFGE